MNATQNEGLVYDAVSIFDFGNASEEPLPDAEPGLVTIRYGGWSLQELRANALVRARGIMWDQGWYNDYPWRFERLPSGIYRLRIPVRGSNHMTFAEQVQLLPLGEEPAPVVLVATALLAHRLQTGEVLLKEIWTRCKEQVVNDVRVVLRWPERRLSVNYDWDGQCHDLVWLSSVWTT